ncbi:hypothetical protein [Hathewaya massiliensis]|uniref:hypothetical protein n=1 Tax=Hathewaya massiliensis TaxID=1964382 RepID=UPI00115BD93F|nr:hypothetical protein [Hathewaya massiliensis]
MIKTICNVEEIIDFAWELSQDNLNASYPRKESIIELKEYIEKFIHDHSKDVIACYDHGVLCGVCLYFWITDEKYAQTKVLLMKGDYDQIAEEFINYISNKLAGYQFLITGIPFTNKNANEYFNKKNIECIEASIVTRICNLKPHTNQRNDCVEEINKDNFEEYARFHDKHAIPLEMYYNAINLKRDIERFRIFAFWQDKEIHGSIFAKANKEDAEVFGLFVDEKYKNKDIESILINEMLTKLYNEFGAIKEIVYFIDENSTDELNLALAAGFEVQAKYRCYKCIL